MANKSEKPRVFNIEPVLNLRKLKQSDHKNDIKKGLQNKRERPNYFTQ